VSRLAGTLSQGTQPFIYGLSGKTLIYKTATVTNTTVNVYTVTSGKIFYLVAAGLTYGIGAGGTSSCALQIDDASNILLELIGRGGAAGESGLAGLSNQAPYPIAAGRVFQVYSQDATLTAIAWIIGWED